MTAAPAANVVRLPTAAPRKVRQTARRSAEALAGVTLLRVEYIPPAERARQARAPDAMAASAPLLLVGYMLPFCNADVLARINALALEHHRAQPTAETSTAVRLLEQALGARRGRQ